MQSVRVWSSIWRNAVMKTSRRNYGHANHRTTTLNDMPIPEGDFFAQHAKRQQGYNTVLGIGIASLSFSLFLFNTTDIVHMHYYPPATYE